MKMRVESGNKLYRYFRLEDQPPPYHYFCSKCMVERYPGDMKRVNKAVIGKAYMMDSTPKLTVELQKALYRLGNDPK